MKNIVIFADGTWNRRTVGAQTNVSKMYDQTENVSSKDGYDQLKYYDPGVGSHSLKYTGGIAGLGISQNIQQCYRFIIAHYCPGDKIFLFGFSRGSFTVRSLSAFISIVGIIKPKHASISRVKEAYHAYRKAATYPHEPRQFKNNYCYSKEDLISAPRGGQTKMASVPYFLGVWDTVGSLGIPNELINKLNPFPHNFHDLRLPTLSCLTEDHLVSHESTAFFGYHALSIDEPRAKFTPTLWQNSEGLPITQEDIPEGHHINQTWFSGVHADVGGGYLESSLSDFSLEWMISKAKMAGLVVNKGYENILHPSHTGLMHDPCTGFPGFAYRTKKRKVSIDSVNSIHGSVFARMLDLKEYRPNINWSRSSPDNSDDIDSQLQKLLGSGPARDENIKKSFSFKDLRDT